MVNHGFVDVDLYAGQADQVVAGDRTSLTAEGQAVMDAESGKGWGRSIKKLFSESLRPFFKKNIPGVFTDMIPAFFKSVLSRKIVVSENVQALMNDHSAKAKMVAEAETKAKKANAALEREMKTVEALESRLTVAKQAKTDAETAKNSAATESATARQESEGAKAALLERLRKEVADGKQSADDYRKQVHVKEQAIEQESQSIIRRAERLKIAEGAKNAAENIYQEAHEAFKTPKSQLEEQSVMLADISSPEFVVERDLKLSTKAQNIFRDESLSVIKDECIAKVTANVKEINEQLGGADRRIIETEMPLEVATKAYDKAIRKLESAQGRKSELQTEMESLNKSADKAQKEAEKHQGVLQRYLPSESNAVENAGRTMGGMITAV